jgi:hypothetical protein
MLSMACTTKQTTSTTILFVLCKAVWTSVQRSICSVRMCSSKCANCWGMKHFNRPESIQYAPMGPPWAKDHNFWACEFSMITRKKYLFFFIVKMIPITPRSVSVTSVIRRGLIFLPFRHSRVALERNVNPTLLASRLGLFDPEIS